MYYNYSRIFLIFSNFPSSHYEVEAFKIIDTSRVYLYPNVLTVRWPSDTAHRAAQPYERSAKTEGILRYLGCNDLQVYSVTWHQDPWKHSSGKKKDADVPCGNNETPYSCLLVDRYRTIDIGIP